MGTSEIWAGPLSDGSKAVILLNRGNDTAVADITFEFSDIGWENSLVSSLAECYSIVCSDLTKKV